ncbi:MAG: hypothetical protein IKD75_09590 [Prevotella sp.]|nr:hypothetical protein [Prevotella sp.]
MGKYTRDQVKAMTQDEYESAICNELNAAGYRHEFNGVSHEYQPDESTFGGAIVFDSDAVNYLKGIGLINNGKCPMCGRNEEELRYRFTYQDGQSNYHVCKRCYKLYRRNPIRGCSCCLGIIIFIGLVIWGIYSLLVN